MEKKEPLGAEKSNIYRQMSVYTPMGYRNRLEGNLPTVDP